MYVLISVLFPLICSAFVQSPMLHPIGKVKVFDISIVMTWWALLSADHILGFRSTDSVPPFA